MVTVDDDDDDEDTMVGDDPTCGSENTYTVGESKLFNGEDQCMVQMKGGKICGRGKICSRPTTLTHLVKLDTTQWRLLSVDDGRLFCSLS